MIDTSVAETILEQLGGKMFIRMVGANHLVACEDSLEIRIGDGAMHGINKIKITLTTMNDYTMEFFSARGAECKKTFNDTLCKTWIAPLQWSECEKVFDRENLYADDLQSAFTANTGFKTTLLAVQK